MQVLIRPVALLIRTSGSAWRRVRARRCWWCDCWSSPLLAVAPALPKLPCCHLAAIKLGVECTRPGFFDQQHPASWSTRRHPYVGGVNLAPLPSERRSPPPSWGSDHAKWCSKRPAENSVTTRSSCHRKHPASGRRRLSTIPRSRVTPSDAFDRRRSAFADLALMTITRMAAGDEGPRAEAVTPLARAAGVGHV